MLATVWGPNPKSNTLDVTDPKLNHRAKETGGRSNLWLLLLAAAAEGILPTGGMSESSCSFEVSSRFSLGAGFVVCQGCPWMAS